MGTQILVESLQMLSTLYLTLIILRFLLQLSRADYHNPISQFVAKATNPVTNPIRRVVPPYGPFDGASLIFAVLFQTLMYAIILGIAGQMAPIVSLLAWGALKVLGLIVTLYFFAIIAMIVISWIAPGNAHPGIQLIFQITEPVMKPFRSILPPMGGLDLSPIFAFLVLNMIRVVLSQLEMAAGMPF